MITFRRASERRYERHPEREDWLTFHPDHPEDANEPLARGFRSLASLKEARFGPSAGVRQPREESEIITYVRDGVLAFEDSIGRAGLIRAGEFQRITVGRGIRYSETNTSPSNWVHVFQIWLRSSVIGLTSDHEQRRFSAADRGGRLCMVASPDGRSGSLLVHQDSCLYSSILQRGQHIVHEIKPGRGVWLHVVDGGIRLGNQTLNQGDGAGFAEESKVSLTASDDAEVLLLDLGPTMLVSPLAAPRGVGPRCTSLDDEGH